MSSDWGIDRGPEQPTAPVVSRPHWTRRKSLVVASCFAATLAAIATWRAASASPPGVWIGRSIVAGVLGMTSGALADTPPPTPAASSATATPAASAPPPAIAKELADLRSAYELLAQRTQDTDQRLDRIEADVTQLKQQFEKQRLAHARASKRAGSSPPRPRVSQVRTLTQRPSPMPRILGVDSWNGQPSVSVLVGAEVRFFSEGDVVADALVKRADPHSQRVEFVTASGTAVSTAAAGAAR
jgi:hypothetical protein